MQIILSPSSRRYDANIEDLQTPFTIGMDTAIYLPPDSNIHCSIFDSELTSPTDQQLLFQSHAGDSRLKKWALRKSVVGICTCIGIDISWDGNGDYMFDCVWTGVVFIFWLPRQYESLAGESFPLVLVEKYQSRIVTRYLYDGGLVSFCMW